MNRQDATTRSGPLSLPTAYSRREMLRQASCGFGQLALLGLVGSSTRAGQYQPQLANPLTPKLPTLRPQAKRVIFLFMHGGVSQVDTFDPKPALMPTVESHYLRLGGNQASTWDKIFTKKRT